MDDAFLINASSAIIDDEIVVPATDGTADFLFFRNELKSRSNKIAMVTFDLLYLNGYDLRNLPLAERKAILQKLIAKTNIQFGESFEGDGQEYSSMPPASGSRAAFPKSAIVDTRRAGATIGSR